MEDVFEDILGFVVIIFIIFVVGYTTYSCHEALSKPPPLPKVFHIRIHLVNDTVKVIDYKARVDTEFEIIARDGIYYLDSDYEVGPIRAGVIDYEILNP